MPSKRRKWSIKYKRSIDCSRPKGFSQKQYCKYGRKDTKNRHTRKYKRKMGGHPNTGLKHWHLRVKFPNGSTRQIPEIFAKTEEGPDGRVISAKVKDIYDAVEDLIRRSYGAPVEPFTLYWKGRKLDRPGVRVRHISVNGEKIQLYDGESNPIIVKYNKDIVEEPDLQTHDLDIDYETGDER